MIVYLDSATNRKGQPSENFAREVMELFTLGEGRYSEQDIRKPPAPLPAGASIATAPGTRWRPALHDDGEKTILGERGNFDGDDVLDILLRQPATAEFIVGKLWREFVSPTPATARGHGRNPAHRRHLPQFRLRAPADAARAVAQRGVLGEGKSRRAGQIAGRSRCRQHAYAGDSGA